MIDLVPATRLTREQEKFCLGKMIEGNELLKKWSLCLGRRKARDFRKMLFSGVKKSGLMSELEQKIPADKLCEFRKDKQVIISVHLDEHPELNSKTVEYAMLCSYSCLARKHAKKWFRRNDDTGMSLTDYLNEGYIALLDAIYGYNGSVEFATYAWKILKNRMIYVSSRSSMLCPLTNDDFKLMQSFEEATKKFNDKYTFEEVVSAMGLSDAEAKSLSEVATKVYSESQYQFNSNDENPNDYTAHRRTIDNDAKQTQTDAQNIAIQVRKAIDVTDLTDFEKLVLDTSMNPYYGWQSKLARESINPETGEPYSRAWIACVLKNAQAKVKVSLTRMAA